MVVPDGGTYFLARPVRLCNSAMKVIGKGTLHVLATGNDAALAGAAHALFAELSAARWFDLDGAARTYPKAEFNGERITIALPSDHCAVIVANFPAGVVLVEFAGPRGQVPRRRALKGKKSL